MTTDTSRRGERGDGQPPRARVSQQSRPQGQVLLLRAAEELFGERSYHRTTVADICARAGMATGSFYSYYGSKAEIFAAVVRAINTDLRQAMRAALEHAEDGQRARERAAFRAYFDMLSDRPWIDRIVRESEFIDPGLFREYYEHLVRGYARGVRAAQIAHEVDARYDPEVIAFAYTGIGNFVGMRWADWTAGGRVPDDVLDDVLELLGRGLAPRVSGLPGRTHWCGQPCGGRVDDAVRAWGNSPADRRGRLAEGRVSRERRAAGPPRRPAPSPAAAGPGR